MIEELSPEQIGAHAASILRTAAAAAETIRQEAELDAERARTGAHELSETAQAHAAATLEQARAQAAAILAEAQTEASRRVQDGEQLLDDACRQADDRAAEVARLEVVVREKLAAVDRAHEQAHTAVEEARRRCAEMVESATREAAEVLADAHRTAERIVEDARRKVAADEEAADEVRERVGLALQQLTLLKRTLGMEPSTLAEPLAGGSEASDADDAVEDGGEIHLISLRRAGQAPSA